MRGILTVVAVMAAAFIQTATCATVAQTTVNGIVEQITPNGLRLASGEAFQRASNTAVTLAGDREGAWSALQNGDRVRLTLNEQRRVVAVSVTGKMQAQRVETPLFQLQPISGGFTKVLRNISINGRVFDFAGWWRAGGSVVYANRDGYDLLEAYVGPPDDGRNGTYTYVVLGDGEELFRSPKVGRSDPPLKISVSIRGYTGITLTSIRNESTGPNFTVWANPVLVKLPSAVPALVSPGMNEKVTQDTPLVWKPVEEAAGYLLELQCERLASAEDAENESRFLVARLPAGTTVYAFHADRMPKGRWRWRVHALSHTGFLGQMDSWRTFTNE